MDIQQAGTFLKVNVAAQRARQLMQGAAPKIATKSRKAAAIAIQEVESGLIEAFTPSEIPDVLQDGLLEGENEEATEED